MCDQNNQTLHVLNELMMQLYEGWKEIDEANEQNGYFTQFENLNLSSLYPHVLYNTYTDMVKENSDGLQNWRSLYENVEAEITNLVELIIKGIDLRMVDMLAGMPYEQRSAVGKLKIVSRETNVQYVNELSNEVEMGYENLRQIRKILEATPPDHFVVGIMPTEEEHFGSQGKGICISGYTKVSPDFCFQIQLLGKNRWRALVNDKVIFEKRSGLYRFPIDMKEAVICEVRDWLEAKHSDNNVERIVELIETGYKQKHGTVLVFGESEIVRLEADRLLNAKRGMGVKLKRQKDLKYVEGYSAIDGAMIFDTDGECYAIGVILDGEAVEGDPSRGARYNSTLAYVNTVNTKYQNKHQNPHIFAIVISEDRYVDFILPKN